MPARTGDEFLKGLRDGREIWVGAERVEDVTGHPALRGAAETVAAIYDLQLAAADRLSYDRPRYRQFNRGQPSRSPTLATISTAAITRYKP